MFLHKKIFLGLSMIFGLYTHTHSPYRSFFGVQPPESFDAHKRYSSYPYICSDTFRSLCDHIIDETNIPFDPKAVREGDLIYVRGYPICLNVFIQYLPYIKNRFVLITHNSDDTLPESYAFLLDHPLLVAWFTQNKGPESHPKLHPLPIGIACNYWPYGDPEVLTQVMAESRSINKKNFLYVNFKAANNPQARDHVWDYFKNKNFCFSTQAKPWKEYLYDLSDFIFVLSPPGNGLDCYRAWETLLLGSIPVMLSTSIDCLFDDLPVIIVKKWDEVTEEFLDAQLNTLKKGTYNFNKLYAPYWIELIRNVQKGIRN